MERTLSLGGIMDELGVWHSFALKSDKKTDQLNIEEKENTRKYINNWIRGTYGEIVNKIIEFGRKITSSGKRKNKSISLS